MFISTVRTECGMFVMYCMQCCMSMSGSGSGAVGWCYVCVRCESGLSV